MDNQCRFSILIALFVGALSFQRYRDRIPNGYNVQDNCYNMVGNRPGVVIPIYQSVGHYKDAVINPFGEDFRKHGRNWTAICELDSDGDGLSNGKELGDEHCLWRYDNTSTHKHLPPFAPSNPGIPEIMVQIRGKDRQILGEQMYPVPQHRHTCTLSPFWMAPSVLGTL